MRVFFDFQIFCLQNYGGISRYHVELIKEFSKTKDVEPIIPFLYCNNKLINSASIVKHYPFFKNLDSERKDRLGYIINRFISKKNISNLKVDILHPTYYDPYILSGRKKPLVITIHDMIHERFPEMFSKNETTSLRKRILSEKADKIIALSEHTKADIMEFFGTKENKITVITQGNSLNSIKAIPVEIDYPFILYVGNRSRYKNFIEFCKGIVPFLNAHQEIKILCAGGGKFSEYESRLFYNYGISNQVRYKKVNDQELTFLYQHALMFVFPSLDEGFGIPLLEALSNSCPVICSSIAPFKEVAQNAAEYFEPKNTYSILQAVNRIYSDINYKNNLIEEGRKRVAYFDWAHAAKMTIQVYSELT